MTETTSFDVGWEPRFRADYNRLMPVIVRSAQSLWLLTASTIAFLAALFSVAVFVSQAWPLGVAMVLIGLVPLVVTVWRRKMRGRRVVEPLDEIAFSFVGDEVHTTAISGRYWFLDRRANCWKVEDLSLESVRVRGVPVLRFIGPDGKRWPYRISTLALPAEVIVTEFAARRALRVAKVGEI